MKTLQPIAGVAADLRAGKTFSVELTQAALARIADPVGEGPRVFTRVYAVSHAQALPGHAVWSWLCHIRGLRSQAEPGNEGVNFGA